MIVNTFLFACIINTDPIDNSKTKMVGMQKLHTTYLYDFYVKDVILVYRTNV